MFQNHGYRGMYYGLTAEDIHKRKKFKKSQHILDHMGTTELAANLFPSTQAKQKLRRDQVQGKDDANAVHYEASVVVRRAIAELGRCRKIYQPRRVSRSLSGQRRSA